MLERRRLHLDLCASGMAWQGSGHGLDDCAGQHGWKALLTSAVAAPFEAELTALASRLPRGSALEMRLGLDLTPLWLQTPFQGSAHLPDWHQALQARAEQLFGPSGGNWWVAADWAMDTPFPAAAWPSQWADALQRSWPGPVLCSSLALVLLQGLADAQQKRDADHWYLLWQGTQYLVAIWSQGGWQLLDTGQRSGDPQANSIDTERLLQLASSFGLPPPDQVQWLDLDQAGHGAARCQDGVSLQPLPPLLGLRPWLAGAATGVRA